MSEVLKVVDVTQRFGGLVALAGIHLYIKPGEIVGIIGPNGAGKTTLFNVITGIYQPTEGRSIWRAPTSPPIKPIRSPRPDLPEPSRTSGCSVSSASWTT